MTTCVSESILNHRNNNTNKGLKMTVKGNKAVQVFDDETPVQKIRKVAKNAEWMLYRKKASK